MIRYPVTLAELEAQIDAINATWRGRAAARTTELRSRGRFTEESGIWRDIKAIYMSLQYNKCAYCERKLESEPYGFIEHDIEHYRPKKLVEKWPSEKIIQERKVRYRFQTGDDWAEGYYLLAYNIFNYVTACKTCNSTLKHNHFPIYGSRRIQSDDYWTLAIEQPLLIYPLGDIDDDPEDLITFIGIIPIPKRRSGYKRYRARVTIDLFELERREELRRQRAECIRGMMIALWLIESDSNAEHVAIARDSIEQAKAPSSPHCNCIRAFHALYQQNRQAALGIYEKVNDYLRSLS